MQTPEEMLEAAGLLVQEANRLRRIEESRPEEPEQVGSFETGDFQYNVICFQKQFNHLSPYYSYAAIQIGEYWYVTGAVQGKQKWTWKDLMDFIGEDGWESVVRMEEGEALSGQ